MKIKYKIELLENELGYVSMVGYNYRQSIYVQDSCRTFSSMESALKWLQENYKS